jgi:hypothetical protein
MKACREIMRDPEKRKLYQEFTAPRIEATFIEDVR